MQVLINLAAEEISNKTRPQLIRWVKGGRQTVLKENDLDEKRGLHCKRIMIFLRGRQSVIAELMYGDQADRGRMEHQCNAGGNGWSARHFNTPRLAKALLEKCKIMNKIEQD